MKGEALNKVTPPLRTSGIVSLSTGGEGRRDTRRHENAHAFEEVYWAFNNFFPPTNDEGMWMRALKNELISALEERRLKRETFRYNIRDSINYFLPHKPAAEKKKLLEVILRAYDEIKQTAAEHNVPPRLLRFLVLHAPLGRFVAATRTRAHRFLESLHVAGERFYGRRAYGLARQYGYDPLQMAAFTEEHNLTRADFRRLSRARRKARFETLSEADVVLIRQGRRRKRK